MDLFIRGKVADDKRQKQKYRKYSSINSITQIQIAQRKPQNRNKIQRK